MNNYVSMEEDQLPAPVRQPTSSEGAEFRPLLADITLYNEDKGKIMPHPVIKPAAKPQGTQGMSFKEWKMKQEQEFNGKPTFQPSFVESGTNDVLSGVKKHVRFNNLSQQTQSLPIIKENAILSPVIESAKSLPPNLLQNPVERGMELSICDTVLKQQQLEEQQRRVAETQMNFKPIFAGLYQQGDAMHLLKPSPKENIVSPPMVMSSPVHQCACQHHPCMSNPSQMNVSPSRMMNFQQQSVAISPEAYRLQEMRADQLEKRVENLQEQLYLLQQQMSYVLQSMQTTSSNASPVPSQPQMKSSNPFLSQMIQESLHEEMTKPKMVDSATQYTIVEPVEQKTPSDKTFFNQVLGQVNQILDNTDESNNNHMVDSRACKYIDSDSSAVSIYERTNPSPKTRDDKSSKKPTDKSTFMDSLAAKYLMSSTNGNETTTTPTQDYTFRNSTAKSTSTGQQDTIDVSTTCYNYLKKYDLLKNYAEDDVSSTGNVLDPKLIKQRQIKF
ncbi:uncharacterized protein LOC134831381 [Culicoides brevitarsis]|uniref:uncharacterized protein LOC134831381 n=1 Tax=Culicoides brevitarsis TaxID=469753 RepID=UPI00307C6EA9